MQALSFLEFLLEGKEKKKGTGCAGNTSGAIRGESPLFNRRK